MSKARDLANLFSGSTDAATDAEVTAAIASHNTVANGHIGRGNTASRPGSPTTGDLYANTQTGFVEIYTGSTYGWEQVGGIASTVTGVTATNSPSGRAYNNGAASIAFTPGTILGRTYTVTSSPGSYTASGATSPITITGLQSSTQYTYTVVAANNYGTASASSASSAVTATTVPQAPSISAVAAAASATLTITPGSTGGSAITEYSIISNPVTTTQTTSSTTYTFTGLTDGTSYTFIVTATNANGISLASSASNSVTPISYLNIDLLIVAGGGGGGWYTGGGGGAGGLVYSTGDTVTRNISYAVNVGGGGTATGNSGTPGGVGNDSYFGSLYTAAGGGRGGSQLSNSGTLNGGSGGGQAEGSSLNAGTSTQISYSGKGFGNPGGNYVAGPSYGGGGGGGAGAAGSNASGNTTAGIGGIGKQYLTFATATSSGANSGYYAGGGGGTFAYVANVGAGGAGGGGAGVANGNGTNGTPNTGGGGGTGSGNSGSTGYFGGGGGSGIIIIRTADTAATATTVGAANGNAPYVTGGYKYYKFTTTGSITF